MTMMQMNNDRFKFRVWDKKNNEYVPEGQMCDVHCLLHRDGALDCGVAYDDGYAGGIDWIKTEDAIIEQCTGLTDKNGKLIYEGDVVREHFEDGGSIDKLVFYNELQCKWYMRYNFRCSLGAAAFWEFGHHISHKLEIIGNIHEREQNE